jgi:hypothetical protein
MLLGQLSKKDNGDARETTNQESFAKSNRYFILEVVCLSTGLGIGGCPLLLQPLGSAVEDLEAGSSRGVDGIGSTTSSSRHETGCPY